MAHVRSRRVKVHCGIDQDTRPVQARGEAPFDGDVRYHRNGTPEFRRSRWPAEVLQQLLCALEIGDCKFRPSVEIEETRTGDADAGADQNTCLIGSALTH